MKISQKSEVFLTRRAEILFGKLWTIKIICQGPLSLVFLAPPNILPRLCWITLRFGSTVKPNNSTVQQFANTMCVSIFVGVLMSVHMWCYLCNFCSEILDFHFGYIASKHHRSSLYPLEWDYSYLGPWLNNRWISSQHNQCQTKTVSAIKVCFQSKISTFQCKFKHFQMKIGFNSMN